MGEGLLPALGLAGACWPACLQRRQVKSGEVEAPRGDGVWAWLVLLCVFMNGILHRSQALQTFQSPLPSCIR